MKDGMNPAARWRKFEVDCHRTNDLCDSKWDIEFRSKLVTNLVGVEYFWILDFWTLFDLRRRREAQTGGDRPEP